MLAVIRPSEWELPLFLHVAGSMAFVGALVLTLVLVGAGTPSRTTFRALLWGVIPSFLVMRVAAQWLLSEQNLEDADFAWIEIGFMATDPGALFIVGATIVAYVSSRRDGPTSRWVTWLTAASLVLSLVAVWAMTTKPV